MSRQTPTDLPLQRENSARNIALPGEANSPSPEVRTSLIDHAKKIISGQVPYQAMQPDPRVAAVLEKKKKSLQSAPPQVQHQIIDCLNLQALYPDRSVACFMAPEGFLVILACGEEEITPLLKALSPEEVAKVVIKHPQPPFIFDAPSPTAFPSASQA